MPTAQNGKAAPIVSTKQQLIIDATFAFLAMKEQMGTSAVRALDLFVEGLNKKTISIRQARAILNDQNKFADFLVKAHGEHRDEISTAIRNAANADIAEIKRATAFGATVTTAAIFCLISLPVSSAEKALFGWVKSEVTPSVKAPQKPIAPPQPSQGSSGSTNADNATIQLKLGPNGFYDIATGRPPKLDGKQKVAVIVSVSPEGLAQSVPSRRLHHHRLKHCSR